jgi:hypothetical protein
MNSNDLNQSLKYNTHVTVLSVRLVAQGIGSSFWIAPHFTLLSFVCRNNFETYLCTPCIYCLCNKSIKKDTPALTTTVRHTYVALASSQYSAPYPTPSYHHSKTCLFIHGSFTLKVAVAPCFEVLEELQHMTQ